MQEFHLLATHSRFLSISAISVQLLLLGVVCLIPRVSAQSAQLQPELVAEASPLTDEPVLAASASSSLSDAPQTSSSPPTGSSHVSNEAGSTISKHAKPDSQTTDEQLKEEERQRILGVIPNFNTVNSQNALPLNPKQKFQLMFKNSVDPFIFATAALDAGLGEVQGSFKGYGWGPEGYFKRFGASYADTADGNLWGNAIFPVLFHEDPRYFRKGTGTVKSRVLYSVSTIVRCKSDQGKWVPNISNVLGNLVSGGISNLYYPSTNRGFELTVQNAVTVAAEGGIGSLFAEFWPDISQRVLHRHQKASRATVQPWRDGAPPSKQM